MSRQHPPGCFCECDVCFGQTFDAGGVTGLSVKDMADRFRMAVKLRREETITESSLLGLVEGYAEILAKWEP